MLALLPVSMAVKTDVTAAEIISDAEETDPVESGEEATSAEETIPAVSTISYKWSYQWKQN